MQLKALVTGMAAEMIVCEDAIAQRARDLDFSAPAVAAIVQSLRATHRTFLEGIVEAAEIVVADAEKAAAGI